MAGCPDSLRYRRKKVSGHSGRERVCLSTSCTADIDAFWAAIKDLRRRFYIRRVVIVADRGMVSEELMEELEKETQGQHEYSGAAEPQFRSRVSQCSGNCGTTVPVMRAT